MEKNRYFCNRRESVKAPGIGAGAGHGVANIMNIKRIYNTKKVYEGWFEAYFIKPWVEQYADFRSGESVHDMLCSLAGWLIVTMGVAGVLMGMVGLLGPDTGYVILTVGGILWCAASLVPMIALISRASNGNTPNPRHPRMLAVDIMQIAACVLFFIFGILMMITTLHSEVLRGDPGTDEPDESTKIQMDTVVEEAIFTYQNAPVDTAQEVADTLEMPEDPDMVDPNESFDPTIAEEGTTPDEPIPNDSIYF